MEFKNKQECLEYISSAFDQIGAYDAEFIYLYSDLRYFAKFLPLFDSKNDLCQDLVDLFLKRGKTVLTTTFSYTAEGNFEVLETPTTLGVINKWFLRGQGKRSEHPMYSYAAIGPNQQFLEGIGKSAFGKHSVFDRLTGKKAGFLHLGRPVEMGNTALHFVEQSCGATYRYNKCFATKVFNGGKYIGTDYSVNVRKLNVPGEDFVYDFRKATLLMRQKGLIQEIGDSSNLSNISFYCYDASIDFLVDQFYKDETIFVNSTYRNYE